MANEALRRLKQDNYAYIDFEVVANQYLSDERTETRRVHLFDNNGSIHAFVDSNWLMGLLAKGWKVLQYANFDIVKPDGTKWEELLEIMPVIARDAKLSKAEKELETLRAEHVVAVAATDPGRLSTTQVQHGNVQTPLPATLHSYPKEVRNELMEGKTDFRGASEKVFETGAEAAAKGPAGYAEGSQPVVVKAAGEGTNQAVAKGAASKKGAFGKDAEPGN